MSLDNQSNASSNIRTGHLIEQSPEISNIKGKKGGRGFLSFKSYALAICLVLSLSLLLTACGEKAADPPGTNTPPTNSTDQPGGTVGGDPSPSYVPDTTPATVRFSSLGWFTQEEFDELIIAPVKAKAPHINIEVMTGSIADQLAASDIPDLVITHNGIMLDYSEQGIMSNLNDIVKEHQMDLGRFNPVILNSLNYEGELKAIPFAVNFTATYYNIDLFEKFGEDYPKDGMTWDDAILLAQKMSRQEGDIHYRGIDLETPSRFLRVLGIDYSDHKTNKPTVDNDKFRTLFELTRRVFEVPGNMPSSGKVAGNMGEFFNDKTVAMLATTNRFFNLIDATKNGLNWDVTSYPTIPGHPNIGTDVDAHVFAIPASSKNKNAALEVIKIFTSDEIQLRMTSETARLSPLSDPKLRDSFASGMEIAQGKNIPAIFLNEFIEAPTRSVYNSLIGAKFGELTQNFIEHNMDVNTAIRDLQEIVEQVIAANPR